jgi:hypothetical protein
MVKIKVIELAEGSWTVLTVVLPRLGYGWLDSAFDGLKALTKLGKPSHNGATGLGRLWLGSALSCGLRPKMGSVVQMFRDMPTTIIHPNTSSMVSWDEHSGF